MLELIELMKPEDLMCIFNKSMFIMAVRYDGQLELGNQVTAKAVHGWDDGAEKENEKQLLVGA